MSPLSPMSVEPDARCYALVPCAGRGERAGPGGPKQYRAVGARSVVAHTLAALQQVDRISATLVVVAPDDREFARHAPEADVWLAAVGGKSRAASVNAGLAELARRGARAHDWVLVHDAARCLVRPVDVDRLIDACIDDEVGGLLALPVADTLKRADANFNSVVRAASTIDRTQMWQAQTPQMFRLALLQRALETAGDTATDEASAVEALGLAPRLVPGRIDNFKLTWPDDFELAERLLRSLP